MELKVSIWLSPYGVNCVAKGEAAEPGHFSVIESSLDMTPHGWYKVKEMCLPVEWVPSREDLIPFAVDKLRAEIREEEKKCAERVQSIKEAIESLRALPFAGTQA